MVTQPWVPIMGAQVRIPQFNIDIDQPLWRRRPPAVLLHNGQDFPHPPDIPYWDAPWPFHLIENQNRTTRKVRVDQTQFNNIERFTKTLLRLPPDGKMITNNYFLDSTISIALNAYNLHSPPREQHAWAYFHWRGNNSCVDVPRNAGPNFDWTRINTQMEPADSGPNSRIAQNLHHDHQGPWPSVIPDAIRWRPNGRKYRLFCWIHRHAIPAGGKYNTQVYSMSVYDREDNRITWHDPWPLDSRTQRWTDIQALWRNAAPAWLRPLRPLRGRTYNALRALKLTTHPDMAPKYSQISCVAIAVWLVRHLESRAHLRPPDRASFLQGLDSISAFPDLAATLFQTLRESMGVPYNPIRGQSQPKRDYVRDNFNLHPNHNERERRMFRRVIQAKFAGHPTLRSRGRWIVDAIAPEPQEEDEDDEDEEEDDDDEEEDEDEDEEDDDEEEDDESDQ
ncbi:hypothetical protein PG987_007533 [Apiospora arundinis]